MAEGDLADASGSGRYPEKSCRFHCRRSGPKWNCCSQAGSTFLTREETPRTLEFQHFCDTTPWLHDFALFMALKRHFHDKTWNRWPEEASRITPKTYRTYSHELGHEIAVQKYLQWQFSRQW